MSPVLAFGDDRSPEADIAWQWIKSHRWEGWQLEVVSAHPDPDLHPIDPDEAELHTWAPDDPRVADEAGFESLKHLRAEVDPRVALISKPWDLVVIGPRGAGMLKSLHLGSTADWLLREPVSPLVIAHQPGTVRKAFVAADGSAHSRRAIDTLASLPWIEGVGVHVAAVPERDIDADAALTDAVDALSGSGADVSTVTLQGRPTHALIDEIDLTEPDLIVMGARGRGGIKRMVIGSTAAAIAGSVHRSILVAHAYEAHAYEAHAYEAHAYEAHAYEAHAYEDGV